MKKKVLIIFILIIGVFAALQVLAGEQLWDWAWSDSVGWVSFRNSNTNAHWEMVNDEPDDDTSYIFTNAGAEQRDYFKIQDPAVGMASAITSVQVSARFIGSVRLGVRLGSSEILDATVYSGAVFGPTAWETFLRPGGGVWTWTDIENMQAIVALSKGAVAQGQISEVYVRVNHAEGSVTLRPNATGLYNNITSPLPTGYTGGSARYGYGVEANRVTGTLFGYAWSEDIGWISFESTSVAGCDSFPGGSLTPRGTCQAYIDFATGEVYGWARACSVFNAGCSGALKTVADRGNWEGWIRFNGALYSAELNDTVNPSEFFNWAWGDNYVIGWLSLNKTNTGIPIDYKVKTNLKLNIPPVAAFNCIPASCQIYMWEILLLDNVSSDPDGSIVLSTWYQDGAPLYSCSLPDDPLCDNTYGTTSGRWSVKLYVEDDKGASDETLPQTVTVLRDIVASFQCSLDGAVWSACSAISPVEGDIVYLRDTSVASEISFGINSVINSWAWLVNGNNAGNVWQIQADATVPSMTIQLTVTDTNGRTDTKQEVLLGIMPLPTWREIAPF